jgi:DNA recombination protein RmuC
MQIEQRAHEVMAYVAQLQGDFDRFRTDFDVVGKHIGNAQSKFAEAEKRLDRFDTKLERAAESEQPEIQPGAVAQELPRALDAA